jgi:transitional endoplasmic reticulum ATPase
MSIMKKAEKKKAPAFDPQTSDKGKVLSHAHDRVDGHTVRDKIVHVETSKETKKIVLPDGMAADDAIVWLIRKDHEENRVVTVKEFVDVYPLDGAYALHKAMSRKYGWTNLVPTPGFFGPEPPEMVGVQISADPNDIIQVPWGRMMIPGVDGFIQTGMYRKNNRPVFLITGQVKRKHEAEVSKLAQLARDIVRKESIYRGQAVRVQFPELDQNPPPTPEDFNPKFIDLSGVKPDELVFKQDTMDLIRTNLFTPIEKTQLCRDHGIPLKRGVLLAGPYGVGKTLTAHVAAKKCLTNGWTFIYLDKVEDLQTAIYFAQQYSPAMVFAEDIDRLISGAADEDRDDAVNGVLNVIDGVDTKHSEVLIALTTNHVDRINQAMLRPGRLDAVISVGPPDAKAAEALVRQYGRGLVVEGEDLTEAGAALDGKIPAVIREVVERAKLGAIDRTEPGQPLNVSGRDLVIAVDSMLTHLELLKPPAPDLRSAEEKAADIRANAEVEAAKIRAGKTDVNGASKGSTKGVTKDSKGTPARA